jgi:two-component system, repressor protein LuxO
MTGSVIRKQTNPEPEASPPAGEAGSGDIAVLVIDDEPSLLRYFEYNIRSLGYRVRTGRSIADLFRMLEEEAFTVLLLDLMLPDGEALDYLPQIVESHPDLSVALVSAHGTIPKAVAAIKHGAVNFIQKPVSPEQLESTIRGAVELWLLKREVHELRRKLEPTPEFHGMIGQSEVMLNLYNLIENSLSRTMAPVMITGESGTGKELVARAIHECGPRSRRPFVAINCAAIPRDLLESELFGHEKGAFTGAIDRHVGCFERADKGTLFLDEICEMDPGLQAKLLRVIQEQAFYRIGGTQQIHVSVRILSATNKDPLEMVNLGKFREDLFYRLNVLPLHLPPLRERREDIPAIATHYLLEFAEQNHKALRSFDREAQIALENHAWSGNVRELRNAIEQIVVMNDGEKVTLEMLPPKIRSAIAPPAGEGSKDPALSGASRPPETAVRTRSELRPFWQIERDAIQRALDLCDGNVQEVARRMEISAATLYRKIEKYGLVK